MSNGPKFFQTMMGKKFYEADVPRLVRVLERIAKALEQQEPADPFAAAAKKVEQQQAMKTDSDPNEVV